jgi:nicotinamidase/pyrazinamidase
MNATLREPGRGDVLLLVDVQNDFLPGGALTVRDGDAVLAPLRHCIEAFGRRGLPIFITRDWHPPRHCSFHEQGGPWPPHCVAGTAGAEFPGALHLPSGVRIISKASSPEVDAYSGFQGTDLAAQLRSASCQRVLIGGLATDYCVRATALDARAHGFEVLLLTDGVRAVEVHAGDGGRALDDMRARGAQLISVHQVPA